MGDLGKQIFINNVIPASGGQQLCEKVVLNKQSVIT